MEHQMEDQMAKTVAIIQDIKQLIKEKGSKEGAIRFLMQETGLSQKECETAVDFYDGIKLP